MRIDELDVKHAHATVNGLRMHYVEKGAGPLVLLLHGFPENWWSWRRQIDPLVQAGYRVVAPDLRGYNDTEAKGPYDIDTLAADVCALIDHLGETRATLVSHDWGGGVAWHLAATRPEHCERLVVMNCPHPVLMRRALLGRWSQMKRSWYMFFFLLPALPERALTRDGGSLVKRAFRSNAVDARYFSDEELQPFVDAVLRPGRAHAMVSWYRAALRNGARDRKAHGQYPIIHVPTLLIWGMADSALGYEDVVPGTERFAPKLEIVPIYRCGHFVQGEQPEKVNAVLLAYLALTEAAMQRLPGSHVGRDLAR